MILLTRPAATAIQEAHAAGRPELEVSLDLGRTTQQVGLGDGHVRFPDGQRVPVADLDVVLSNPGSVYAVLDGGLEKVTWFSEETGKVYTLRDTGGWPALEISGILMQRIKGTDPRKDAASKVQAIRPVRGRVLETCFGLGYSALHSAREADSVVVYEIDPNVVEMARLNPYSAPVFEPDSRIEVRSGDIAEEIRGLPDAAFDAVLHDPPTLAIAGDLYADAFYRELFRVLKPGGRLFHYTGDPGSRNRRQDLPGRVAQRLGEVGFARVRREPKALGVSARRPRA
ncbi:MAG TPA: methyltransferase domain-containing protein [Longimicrobiales bacterium]|nr:methyltransferase domain-containing protein [Longimicrobiales bacterium]